MLSFGGLGMATSKPIIYWDTCIFLAWIYNEPHEDGVLDGIAETVKRVDGNKVSLITSVVTRSEILDSRLGVDKSRLDALFDRPNVVRIALDHRISDLSHDIRDYYDQRSIKIETPDSQHLATAIMYNADEFQTLDAKLLARNGLVMDKYPLRICRPFSDQRALF